MATIAELKGKIEKMKKVIDNPNTSPDIKKSLELGVEGAKEALAKLEAEEKKEPSAKTDEKKEKASPTARKEARSALDKCRELLKKYEDKKENDADRVEKRRKAGKPAELTPAEAVSKGAKSVKSKVVDMTEKDKHLKKAEVNAMVSAIVETVKSTISGIEGAQARDEFINSLIDRLSDMKSRSKSRAESGMFVDTSGPGVKDKVISWIGMNREKLEHYTDTEFIIHMMEIINHFPHAIGVMKMGGSIPDVEFTVMHEGKRTKVIAKSVREARMKGAEKFGADPEEVSAFMSSYDIHADMFSYHPEEEMANGGMMAEGGIVYEPNSMVSKPYYFSSNAGLFTQKIYRIDNKFDDNRYLHADFPIGKGGYTKKEALEKANDFYDFVKSAKSIEEYENLSEEYITNNRKRKMANGGEIEKGEFINQRIRDFLLKLDWNLRDAAIRVLHEPQADIDRAKKIANMSNVRLDDVLGFQDRFDDLRKIPNDPNWDKIIVKVLPYGKKGNKFNLYDVKTNVIRGWTFGSIEEAEEYAKKEGYEIQKMASGGMMSEDDTPNEMIEVREIVVELNDPYIPYIADRKVYSFNQLNELGLSDKYINKDDVEIKVRIYWEDDNYDKVYFEEDTPDFLLAKKAANDGKFGDFVAELLDRNPKHYVLPKEGKKMDMGGMMERGGKVSKYNVSFNYNPGNVSDDYLVSIVERYTKDWRHNNDQDERSFFVMRVSKDDAESLVSDLSGEDVYNVEMDASRYDYGGMMAMGGRPSSAINRDRAYQSDEEWEKNYKRRSVPSNPRYNTKD